MSSRKCSRNRDVLCYLYSSYVVLKQRQKITTFDKQAYFAYCGLKTGYQDQSWACHRIHKTCAELLSLWRHGKKTSKSLQFEWSGKSL